MSYTNVYPSRINWENEPSIASPINATNLNKLDYAAYEFDQTFATWDITKANQSDLLLSVKSIDYDTETGVFVITWQNGTTKTVDLNIEKIPVSFSMSPQGVITMTTDDGTTYTADVGSLIKTYTFSDSTEIDFTVTTDASGNKTVTAALKDGSIVGTKLEPNYLANCQNAANSASGSATAADGSAEDSEAWAVGTRDGVPVPSSDPAYENNSKYWAQHTTSSFAGLTDTDITNPTNGQVPVYNSTSQKWENANQGAGGGSKVVVSTAEASLIGTTCILAQGGDSYTATFDSNGVAMFEGVTLTGTVTITATDGVDTATRTLEIPYFGNYTQTISFFSATITATFPADKGATCTCDGVTASTSPYTFTVGAAGTYSVVCTLDGVNKSVSVPISTDGQTESVNFAFGTINLTYDNAFRGLTITCVNGGTTISKTAPISGNTMAFYPPSTGEWIISATYSGVPYQTSATITSLAIPVSASLQQVPNGKTVTPTDDIDTWIKCAGLTNDNNYTALAEVMADTELFDTLLRDSNACDYMARSTTWVSTICDDHDVMTRIGLYDYCSEKLLSNATWAETICNSGYRDSVFDITVPTMTSDTTPSGVASADTYYSGYPAWKAFDGDNTTEWIVPSGAGGNGHWVRYEFPSTVTILCAYIKDGLPTKSYKIQGSNDGFSSDIHDLYEETLSSNTGLDKVVIFSNPAPYKYYRFLSTSNTYYSDGRCSIVTLQFYGRHSSEQSTTQIHSAPQDTIYYMDNGDQVVLCTTDANGVGEVDWSDFEAGVYTIYSSVAKDPNNLSNDYGKSVRVTKTQYGHTTDAYIMPDAVKTLYWYGVLNAQYNTQHGTRAESQATFNTNNISLYGYIIDSSRHQFIDLCFDTITTGYSKLNVVCTSINSHASTIGLSATYPPSYNTFAATLKSPMTVGLNSCDISASNYPMLEVGGGTGVITALWYE